MNRARSGGSAPSPPLPLLTQPAEDRWTPHHLSVPVLSRITKVPVGTVMLGHAGHYPLEEPGLRQMQDAIADFVTKCAA